MDRCLIDYVDRLEDELAGVQVIVLPGVRELLTALAGDSRVTLGLLTGNVERGARLKLGPTGLSGFFDFGAFGSDAERRSDLATLAVARARAHAGISFIGAEVVIVGDTPADVTCGAHLGVSTIAVTTGRHGRAELAAAGADHVVADLSQWRRIFRIILDEERPAPARRAGERSGGSG
jgi:phosphoglycolate phosphatase-like HAD superfamily hydrolase